MATKFLFDTEFSPVGGRNRVQEAPQPAKPVVYSEAEAEQLKADAFRAGLEAGQSQAQGNTEATLAAATARLGDQLQVLLATQTRDLQTVKQEAAELAFNIAAKLAPTLIRQKPETEVLGLLQECLNDLRDEPRIVVRAHDDICPALVEKVDSLSLSAGFQGNVIVLPDPDRAPGDCLVEWADGGTERNLEGLQRTIDGIISRFTQSVAGTNNE